MPQFKLMKFSHFPLTKYIVNIITCCILLYKLNGYCHGLRTFRWLNQFSTYRGEVEPNPCGWKLLASYISKAPWKETPTILSFFDNIYHCLKYAVFLRITQVKVIPFWIFSLFHIQEYIWFQYFFSATEMQNLICHWKS